MSISYYKKYNASCFMYLSQILSKLHMFKVTNFMTFSDGLLAATGYGRYVPSHICPRRYVLNLLLRFYVIFAH